MDSNSINRLTEIFMKFPGIGPRQARRFVYFILHSRTETINELVQTIHKLRQEVTQCKYCFRFFSENPKAMEKKVCRLCGNPSVNKNTLLVVEKDADLDNIVKAGSYDGLYFVLGGLATILEKEPQIKIRSSSLISRIESLAKENKEFNEVILALSASVEGDHTAEYLKRILEEPSKKLGFKISLLGRGLSTGTELEYSDPETIKEALNGRH